MSASRNSRWSPRACGGQPVAAPGAAVVRGQRGRSARGSGSARTAVVDPRRQRRRRRSRRPARRSRPRRAALAGPARASSAVRVVAEKGDQHRERRASAPAQAALPLMVVGRAVMRSLHAAGRARARWPRLRAPATSSTKAPARRRPGAPTPALSDELDDPAAERQAEQHRRAHGRRRHAALPSVGPGQRQRQGAAAQGDEAATGRARSWQRSPTSRRRGRSAGSAPGSGRCWRRPGWPSPRAAAGCAGRA